MYPGRLVRHLGYMLCNSSKNETLKSSRKSILLSQIRCTNVTERRYFSYSSCYIKKGIFKKRCTLKNGNAVFLKESRCALATEKEEDLDTNVRDEELFSFGFYRFEDEDAKVALKKLVLENIPESTSDLVKDSGPSLCFRSLISALKEGNYGPEIYDLIISVYEELLEYKDWKTGLALYKILKKFTGVELTKEHIYIITYILIQTYARCEKTSEECWKFINRLRSLDMEPNEKSFILIYRITLLESIDSRLKTSQVSMLNLYSHIPEARSALMLHYSKIGDSYKVAELYKESLESSTDTKLKHQKKLVHTALNTLKSFYDKNDPKNQILPWLIEHTIIFATDLLSGFRIGLYNVHLDISKIDLSNLQFKCKDAKSLILSSIELLQRASGKISPHVEAEKLDEDYVISVTECTFPNLYEYLPHISTLEIFKNAIISLYRAIILEKGYVSFGIFVHKIRAIPYGQYHNNNIYKCMDMAMTVCLVDFLRMFKCSTLEELNVIAFIFGSERENRLIDVIVKNIKIIYVLNTNPPVSERLYAKFRNAVIPGTSNSGLIVKKIIIPACTVYIDTMLRRGVSRASAIPVNRRDFPYIIISLTSHLFNEDVYSFSFFERLVYAGIPTAAKIPLSYYKRILEYYVKFSKKNKNVRMYFNRVHDASNILYRMRLNNYPIDIDTMKSVMKIINSDKIKTQFYKHPIIKHCMVRIVSYLHLLIESIEPPIDDEFIFDIIKGLISNELYLDFEYAYAKLKCIYNCRLTTDMLLEIVRQFQLSPSGCAFVTNEFRFEVERELADTQSKWTTDLVDSIALCCLNAGSLPSALSFLSDHVELASLDTLKTVLHQMKSYGSLCDDERLLVNSWINEKSDDTLYHNHPPLNRVSTLKEIENTCY